MMIFQAGYALFSGLMSHFRRFGCDRARSVRSTIMLSSSPYAGPTDLPPPSLCYSFCATTTRVQTLGATPLCSKVCHTCVWFAEVVRYLICKLTTIVPFSE